MMKTGLAYRQELSLWVDGRPPHIDFLEIRAEDFLRPELQNRLAELAAAYPLAVRSHNLSLGSPEPPDEDRVGRLAALVAVTDPLWLSEPIAFSRTGEVDLGCLIPVRSDSDTLGRIAGRARAIAARCGVPLLLETIASHLRLDGTMPETEFVNRLCDESGCGLLLDITALFVNGRNHGFDPCRWLREIDPRHIRHLHLSGFSLTGGRWEDWHADRIQPEIWTLADAAMAHASVHGTVLEYDIVFPAADAIEADLRTLRNAGSVAA